MKIPTGDMYNFIDAIWNPVSGKCFHNCSYCYVNRIMKRFQRDQDMPHINEAELKCNLGKNKTIFVCSGCDLFADDVPRELIIMVIQRTLFFPENKYIFQTKNPGRLDFYRSCLDKNIHKICTTIETNRSYTEMGTAPKPRSRAESMMTLFQNQFDTMVTIEPIMDFDLYKMLTLIALTGATQVNIGADTGNNHLPEPSREKNIALITELEKLGIVVVQKKNLRRLMA